MSGSLTTKGVAIATSVVVVAAGVGLGIWYLKKPKITVVQRSNNAVVSPSGEQTVVAGCEPHETIINGGFAVGESGFVTRNMFLGAAWLVSGYNPGTEPISLTAYAVCVNAKLKITSGDESIAFAYDDRNDKIGNPAGDLAADTLYSRLRREDRSGEVVCPTGQPIGAEFWAGRLGSGPVRPVPVQASTLVSSRSGVDEWRVKLNPGAQVNHEVLPSDARVVFAEAARSTQVLARRQAPVVNYAVTLRAICADLPLNIPTLANVSVASGSTVEASQGCPKGTHVVGGGFSLPEPAVTDGGVVTVQRFYEDGFLFAMRSAPTANEPSGKPVRNWHVAAANQESAGWYNNSVFQSGDNAYMGSRQGGTLISAFKVPASQTLEYRAICATIDAEPTGPALSLVPISPPELSPVLDLSPRPTTAPPSSSPSPNPSTSIATSQPLPPTVTITSPQVQAALCYGVDQQLNGTATTRPAGVPITSASHTKWEAVDAQGGRHALGNGASVVYLPNPNELPEGVYTIVFTATDPTTGLKASAQVGPIYVNGC